MTVAAFPHAYPFRFVDRVSERTTVSGGRTVPPDPPGPGFGGRVRIRVTGNARVAMGEGWRSVLLYPEAIAQAALLLEGRDAEAGRRGYLAGVSELSIERAEAEVGLRRVGDERGDHRAAALLGGQVLRPR